MLTIPGAEFGPAKLPMASPIAPNGMAPATSAAHNSSHCPAGMRTPPKMAPSAKSRVTTSAPNVSDTTPLATKYAAGGMGLARFTSSQPSPRSTATPAPNA